jgi:hypothetical protein
MVEYVEVGTAGRRASVRLTEVTLLVGTGKSLFLEILHQVLSNIGKKLPRLGKDWSLYMQSGDVSYSVVVSKRRVRQSISVEGEEVVFEYVPEKSAHRLIKPIDVAVTSADVIMPEVKTEEHVSVVAEEEIERLNRLIAVAKKRLSVRTQILGPYINPKSLIDANTKQLASLDRHGRNLPGVLSYLSLHKPTSYDSIRAALRKLGFSVSVGLAKPGKIGVLISTKDLKMPLFRAPCSIKSFLVIATALELNPDLLLVDNFDYCLTRKTAEAIATLLKQKPTKLIAEIHNEEVIDWLDLSNKSIVEIKL